MFRQLHLKLAPKREGWAGLVQGRGDEKERLRKKLFCGGNGHLFGLKVGSGADSNNKEAMNQSHN